MSILWSKAAYLALRRRLKVKPTKQLTTAVPHRWDLFSLTGRSNLTTIFDTGASFLSWHGALQGSSTLLVRCFRNYRESRTVCRCSRMLQAAFKTRKLLSPLSFPLKELERNLRKKNLQSAPPDWGGIKDMFLKRFVNISQGDFQAVGGDKGKSVLWLCWEWGQPIAQSRPCVQSRETKAQLWQCPYQLGSQLKVRTLNTKNCFHVDFYPMT